MYRSKVAVTGVGSGSRSSWLRSCGSQAVASGGSGGSGERGGGGGGGSSSDSEGGGLNLETQYHSQSRLAFSIGIHVTFLARVSPAKRER